MCKADMEGGSGASESAKEQNFGVEETHFFFLQGHVYTPLSYYIVNNTIGQ
jgi:hypothetical protein